MVKPSDLVRPPPACPTPDKRAYRSAAAARRAHRDSYWTNHTFRCVRTKPKLYPYRCCCTAWHLTHHTPEEQAAAAQRIRRHTGRAPTTSTHREP